MIRDDWRTRSLFQRIALRAAVALVAIASGGCSDPVSAVGTSKAANYLLRVQADGAGSGTVTTPDASPQLACTITKGALGGVCAMAYPGNSTVRLVATSSAGSTFMGWSGACAGAGECVVDMSGDRVTTAAFAPR